MNLEVPHSFLIMFSHASGTNPLGIFMREEYERMDTIVRINMSCGALNYFEIFTYALSSRVSKLFRVSSTLYFIRRDKV
jgi:hypothetical protein